MEKITAKELIHNTTIPREHIIDVRNADEYSYIHIPGSTHIPLDEIPKSLKNIPTDQNIYLICQSGNRSSKACQILQSAGWQNIINVEGGIRDYQKAGGCTLQTTRSIPVIRQVMIIAGILVLFGVLLSYWINPLFIIISAFAGAGLLFAGITGWCALAKLLEKMPWNKVSISKRSV